MSLKSAVIIICFLVLSSCKPIEFSGDREGAKDKLLRDAVEVATICPQSFINLEAATAELRENKFQEVKTENPSKNFHFKKVIETHNSASPFGFIYPPLAIIETKMDVKFSKNNEGDVSSCRVIYGDAILPDYATLVYRTMQLSLIMQNYKRIDKNRSKTSTPIYQKDALTFQLSGMKGGTVYSNTIVRYFKR